jgi:hypothetical protein
VIGLRRMICSAGAVSFGLLLAGCAGDRIESGVFHSVKGYQVGLPGDGWRVEPTEKADLELAREAPPAGMLTDATCGSAALARPLPVLVRHLTFGLSDRTTVVSDTWTVGGRPAAHRVIRGKRDGAEVLVEAVVLKGERCVHDFLYVAPAGSFEDGRPAFSAFVHSFVGDRR